MYGATKMTYMYTGMHSIILKNPQNGVIEDSFQTGNINNSSNTLH